MQGLFNPFKQAQRLAGGTGDFYALLFYASVCLIEYSIGLGLYSLSKRMEAINGYFGVKRRSDGQQGSVFWFAIPYIPDTISADLYQLYDSNRQFDLNNPELGISHSHDSADAPFARPTNSNVDSLSSFLDIPTTIPPPSLPLPFAIPPINTSLLVKNNEEHYINPRTPMARSLPSTPMNFKRVQIVANMPAMTNTVDALAVASSPDAAVAESQRDPNASTAPRVLLVDDSPPILKVVSMMLRKHGYDITTAENGDIAVQLVEEQWKLGKSFDFIVMDLQMPVMDGLEATRRLRNLEKERSLSVCSHGNQVAEHADMKEIITSRDDNSPSTLFPVRKEIIIAMSANHDEETIEQTRKVGFDDFIAKPFSMEKFQDILSRVLPDTPS
jgi:CheY-like chemotaxis protein